MNPCRRGVIRGTLLASALLVVSAATLPAAATAASSAPHWTLSSFYSPTHFAPADATGSSYYVVEATNTGAAPTDGSPIALTDILPPGFAVHPVPASGSSPFALFDDYTHSTPCAPGPPVSCTFAGAVAPGGRLFLFIPLDVPAATGPVLNQASVSGGGAPSASATSTNQVSPDPAAPGFQSAGFSLTDAAGAPLTQAGAHPYRMDVAFELNTLVGEDDHGRPAAGPKDISVKLPPGLIVNPQATPVLCTEAELEQVPPGGVTSCPRASAAGLARYTFNPFGNPAAAQGQRSAVYAMVPPPGRPAAFAFNAVGLGFYAHVLGALDSAGDYALGADVRDLTQFGLISGADVELWGDPSDPGHDALRGDCGDAVFQAASCPVASSGTPMLTMPSACSGPLRAEIEIEPWEVGVSPFSATSLTRDESGAPVGVSGCEALDFEPTLTAQPTTAAADSPTGLDVSLHVPQSSGQDTLATANLKSTTVTLPQGMAVNPSSANGLGACSPAQIGLTTAAGQSPAHFTAAPDTCPDQAKVGTVQITTPLLDVPLQGQVYLAQQDQNPFPNPSLLALYITVKDPATGLVLKLPGKVSPDPDTGQLTASFDDTPMLPFSDFDLHFTSGDRATLVTPPSCGNYQTSSQLTPWSAADPDNPTPAETVTSTDSFQVTTGPNGGPCPDYLDPARFTPSLSAGTESPQAGSSSPFNLRIARPDGQQSIKRIHLDLPPGLLAKLAGVPRCPQSAITPGVGGSTNCRGYTQIGTATIGAGAGDTPFFLPDQPVYLTDGYNGAPYGIAIDTHALAGPFDLGHVVVRSTLNVDPDDAQVHIDSEQLPSILDGIPLHIRDIRVSVDRPGFMQAPTNCNPMQVTGTVTGGGENFDLPTDDTVKPVSTPFQVSGCGGLGFAPKLYGAILNGSQGIHRSDHPNLQFNLGYSPGDANPASVSVLLPQSLQIDQANLGNICSETQLIQSQCAGRNTVGTASATTPILGSTLSGPVYAVSGSGGLPKLAVILNGPPADPVHLLVRGITDTVGARIRNTFPLVPDAPVNNFTLTLNGGPAGYLVNNTDVCSPAKGRSKKAKKKANKLRKTNLTADASYVAQDGDTFSQQVPISAQCPKAKKSKKSSSHRKHH